MWKDEKLPISWRRQEISQNPQNFSLKSYFEVFYKEWFLVLNYIEKNCSAILKLLKMNFGSKFGAWVSSHTAILQSWKFLENLRRTFVISYNKLSPKPSLNYSVALRACRGALCLASLFIQSRQARFCSNFSAAERWQPLLKVTTPATDRYRTFK